MVNWCYRYYQYQETGFYYLQTRYYDPVICRFINADTFATTDITGLLSTNMFSYCENNPIMGVDPSGELHILIGALLGGMISGCSEIASQVISGTKLSNINWSSVLIETASGAFMGAAMAAGVPPKCVKTSINVVTSVAHSIDNGDSLGKTILNAGKTAVFSSAKGICQKLTSDKSKLGPVGLLVRKYTYEPKHAKYYPVNSIISNRGSRFVTRTAGYIANNFFSK